MNANERRYEDDGTLAEKPFGFAKRWWLMILRLSIIGAIGIALWPVSYGLTRLGFLMLIGVAWVCTLVLLWRRNVPRFVLLFLTGLVACFLLLPARRTDAARLRDAFVRQLRSYEGTRYVWGGENSLGIDCSGLPRRSLVNAALVEGATTLNPQLVRTSFSVWWNDLSAKAIKDGHRELTRPVGEFSSIAEMDHALIAPGDMAVTTDGVHVLVYLGHREWMEADPGVLKVIRLTPEDSNAWLRRRVRVTRWQMLAEGER